MSDKPLQLEYGTSNAVSPEENILRGLFTYFLNLGTFDERMRSTHIEPESKRTDHVGVAFLKAHREALRDEFIAWVKTDALASYLCNEALMRDLKERFKTSQHAWTHAPVDSILGTRFKLVTGFERKNMPKDLKKSFYIKAYNRLVKFIREYADQPELRQHWDGDKRKELSIEQFLKLALDPKGKQHWFQSEPLREIRNLYQTMMKHEKVDDVVEELMRQAAVAGVMLS